MILLKLHTLILIRLRSICSLNGCNGIHNEEVNRSHTKLIINYGFRNKTHPFNSFDHRNVQNEYDFSCIPRFIWLTLLILQNTIVIMFYYQNTQRQLRLNTHKGFKMLYANLAFPLTLWTAAINSPLQITQWQWHLISNEHVIIVGKLILVKINISLEADTRATRRGEGCVVVSTSVSVNIRGKRRCHGNEGELPTWRSLPPAQCVAEGRRERSERGLLSGIYARASPVTCCKEPRGGL